MILAMVEHCRNGEGSPEAALMGLDALIYAAKKAFQRAFQGAFVVLRIDTCAG